MRHFALVLICAAIALPVIASVKGLVIATDGTPLSDVHVMAFRPHGVRTFRDLHRDPLATTRTNREGQFSIDVAGNGLVEIQLAKDGFAPAEVIVALDESAG